MVRVEAVVSLVTGILGALPWTALGSGCGDCWCVVANGSQCPRWRPQNYSLDSALLAALTAQEATNAPQLSCNPYEDPTCDTSPPLSPYNATSGAVCALKYSVEDCSSYSLVTLPSRAAAVEAAATGSPGLTVTHTGSCGVCSTAQDLAVYMSITDMTAAGERCATLALVSEDLGLECYLSLGYTEACSRIWLYDGLYDARACARDCAGSLDDPYNLPPDCALNPCLQCDEDQAGPIFQRFAGRTRRRSGIESAIQRPCNTVARVRQVACPFAPPLV
mmetsp:Transcript_929/g.3027  ORF Transcript_929/g.3027 Transcript_929/m.3027 type:complete len:277 (-) Transcript_929:233-1063(-)